MGYTRYWDRTEKPITETFVKKVKEIIKDSESKGIHIGDGGGMGEPIVTTKHILFNGDASKRLDHETCFFNNSENERGFNFCKTARKPYDYTVREVLKAAEAEGLITNVSSDGENEEIISDDEAVEKGYAC